VVVDPQPSEVVNHRVVDQFDAFLLAIWNPSNEKLQVPERHEQLKVLVKKLGGAHVDPDARDLLELKLLPFVVSALADDGMVLVGEGQGEGRAQDASLAQKGIGCGPHVYTKKNFFGNREIKSHERAQI